MKTTANGEIFDMNLNSAAHTTLPLPSIVEVTNLENGRKLKVRVNDRGPFIGGRIIDLSREAARELGYDRQGLAQVRVRYIGPAPLGGPQDGVRYAQAAIPAPAAPLRTKPAETITVASSLPSPTAVSVQQLAPLASAPPPQASSVAAFRIQAGAFSDQVNAQRAVAQLASAGAAVIEPMQRQGTTLYRVLLQGPADEAEAFAFRDRVAGIGSPDARVVRPF
jgi:rare lipoprotein A